MHECLIFSLNLMICGAYYDCMDMAIIEWNDNPGQFSNKRSLSRPTLEKVKWQTVVGGFNHSKLPLQNTVPVLLASSLKIDWCAAECCSGRAHLVLWSTVLLRYSLYPGNDF